MSELLISIQFRLAQLNFVIDPFYSTGYKTLVEFIFVFAYTGVVIISSSGTGLSLLKILGSSWTLDWSEDFIFGTLVGFGILAYGILFLGLIGWLNGPALAIWICVFILGGLIGLISSDFHVEDLHKIIRWSRVKESFQKAALILIGLGIVLSLANALSPAWYQDSLIYHLQGAQEFLKAGRIVLLPEIWQANGPFTIEMLFLLGLVVNNTIFAKLIHFSYALILMLGTYVLGKRIGGERVGFWGTMILAGMPMLMFVSSLAYVDVAWAAYSFLGTYAVLRWQEEDERYWLFLGGLMLGFSLGIKYLAWGQLAVIGVYFLWQSWHKGIKKIVSNGVLLGGTAVIVGSPWYLKNWFLSGNPVYPFVLGGEGWDQFRLSSLSAFLNSFGSGKSFTDLLLFPVNVFLHIDRFATSPFDLLSFLFILIPVVFWLKRSTLISGLISITFLGFVPWWMGSQQTRFLLPLLPGLSLVTAFVIIGLFDRSFRTRLVEVVIRIMCFSLGTLQIVYLISYFVYMLWIVRPLPQILGLESRESFLNRMVTNYKALRFADARFSDGIGISIFWDGAGYYCENCTLGTSAQWAYVSQSHYDMDAYTEKLHELDFDLILYNWHDRSFFLSHDPGGEHQLIADFMEEDYLPTCGRELYKDDAVSLYEMICE